jgi:SPP1 family predicted phage head-tail adaptor
MMAGKLDRRITIEAPGEPIDGDPYASEWYEVAEVWAEQLDRAQAERFATDQTLAEAVRVFRIRWRQGITPLMRVRDEYDALWNITGVSEGDGRRTETVLVCKRYDPNDRFYE